MADLDFKEFHSAMETQVDEQFLPSVSTALISGREVVDTFCYGLANKEAGIPSREDHIFRTFSNTKLVTSCAVLMLLRQDDLSGMTLSRPVFQSLVIDKS